MLDKKVQSFFDYLVEEADKGFDWWLSTWIEERLNEWEVKQKDVDKQEKV